MVHVADDVVGSEAGSRVPGEGLNLAQPACSTALHVAGADADALDARGRCTGTGRRCSRCEHWAARDGALEEGLARPGVRPADEHRTAVGCAGHARRAGNERGCSGGTCHASDQELAAASAILCSGLGFHLGLTHRHPSPS